MRKIIVAITIVVAAFFLFFTGGVSAKVLSNESGLVTVSETEVVNDDLFVRAATVEVDGTVSGDVYIAAQSVKISGTINGNLYIAAQTVNVAGTVNGSVYIGAQNVTLTSARIEDSVLVGCQSLTTDDKTLTGGSILAGAETIQVNSQIKRNAFLAAGNLTVGSNAVIGKDLYYAVGQKGGEADISKSAKVGGTVHKAETPKPQPRVETVQKQIPAILRAAGITGSIIAYLGALVIGFIYFKLFGKHLSKTTGTITSSLWKSLGVGFLITVAFIPAIIVLLLTVIGIPVAGLAVLILLLFIYLSKIVVGSVLGAWVSKRMKWKMPTYGAFALGLAIIYILRYVPFLGGIVGVIVLWIGVGSLVLSSFSTAK